MAANVGDVRLLYQSFGPEQNRRYLESLEKTLQVAGAEFGAVVDVGSLPGAKLGQKQHRAFHLAAGAALLDEVYAASQRGYDAAVVGNIQDPALYECRQVCRMPVVGLLEAVLTCTRPFGTSVALITTSELTIPLLRERAQSYGELVRLHSIQSADLPLQRIADAFGDEAAADALLDRFDEVAVAASAAGADLLVPASGILATLLAARRGQRAAWEIGCPAPVVSPVFIAVAHAAGSARLSRHHLPVSRRSAYRSPTPADLEAYFSERLGGQERAAPRE